MDYVSAATFFPSIELDDPDNLASSYLATADIRCETIPPAAGFPRTIALANWNSTSSQWNWACILGVRQLRGQAVQFALHGVGLEPVVIQRELVAQPPLKMALMRPKQPWRAVLSVEVDGIDECAIPVRFRIKTSRISKEVQQSTWIRNREPIDIGGLEPPSSTDGSGIQCGASVDTESLSRAVDEVIAASGSKRAPLVIIEDLKWKTKANSVGSRIQVDAKSRTISFTLRTRLLIAAEPDLTFAAFMAREGLLGAYQATSHHR
jgi:hypothetical protein